MAGKGWIMLHREIQDCWVAEDKPYNYMAAWIDLLLLANHKETKLPFNNEVIPIERGSFITSKRKLGERWGWSVTKVSRFLEILKSDEMIAYKSDTKKTLVTVENYAFYQDRDFGKEHQSNTKETQEEHKENTKRNQKETNNNDKQLNNVNNDKNNIIRHKYGEYKNVLLSDSDLHKLMTEFPDDYEERIERLSEYIASTGKKYKNHLATIRNWARKEAEKKQNDSGGIDWKNV